MSNIIGENPISPKTTSSFSIASLITHNNQTTDSSLYSAGQQHYDYNSHSFDNQSAHWFQRNLDSKNMDSGKKTGRKEGRMKE